MVANCEVKFVEKYWSNFQKKAAPKLTPAMKILIQDIRDSFIAYK